MGVSRFARSHIGPAPVGDSRFAPQASRSELTGRFDSIRTSTLAEKPGITLEDRLADRVTGKGADGPALSLSLPRRELPPQGSNDLETVRVAAQVAAASEAEPHAVVLAPDKGAVEQQPIGDDQELHRRRQVGATRKVDSGAPEGKVPHGAIDAIRRAVHDDPARLQTEGSWRGPLLNGVLPLAPCGRPLNRLRTRLRPRDVGRRPLLAGRRGSAAKYRASRTVHRTLSDSANLAEMLGQNGTGSSLAYRPR
jgi:hypothetical protein